MALIDAKLLFASGAEDIHTAAQLAALTPVNLEGAYDAGKGEPLVVELTVTEAFAGGTSFALTLTTCATSGGTYVTVATSKVELAAALVVGKIIRLPVPEGISQYLKLSATIVGTFTAGQGTARLVPAA